MYFGKMFAREVGTTPREETGRLVVLADFLAYFDIFGQY